MAEHGGSGHDNEIAGVKFREVEDLKKLSPGERIKRLKELEEERKKEIEQAEELIKESVRELADAEEKKKIPIPQARATELSALTTAEEKQVVATHHLLATEQSPTVAASQQQKSLEEVAAEEAPAAQQNLFTEKGLSKTQLQKFQKPEYALGTEQQRSAFGEYLSKSQQTVTGSGMRADGSPIEEKITDFYKEKSVTGAETGDPQQKYFGTRQQVTGGYELRKREEEDKKTQSDFYRKRGGGPA